MQNKEEIATPVDIAIFVFQDSHGDENMKHISEILPVVLNIILTPGMSGDVK